MTEIVRALDAVGKLRNQVKARHPGFLRTEEADSVLDLVERALTDAGDEIARLYIERNEITAAMRDLAASSRKATDVMAEAQSQLAAYRGELAARDGRETILTFDRIGPNGVPTDHAEGTILACTDSDRRWRLSGEREWVPLP